MIELNPSVISNLNEELTKIAQSVPNKVQQYDRQRKVCQQHLELLDKEFEDKLDSIEVEIRYYKSIRPQIYCKEVFYNNAHHIAENFPLGLIKCQRQYLKANLKLIQAYFKKRFHLFKYYRNNETRLDEHYFVRQSLDKDWVGEIMACEMIEQYLHEELQALGKSKTIQAATKQHKPFQWTASKTALIELLYAIQTAGCVNNGRAELKELADMFSQTFDINLGEFYRTFSEIRIRKGERTKFLDTMKAELIKRMDDDNFK